MADHIKWMLLGVVVLLLLKYIVFGLDAWDGALHPERREPTNSPYRRPFFGVL